jgi:hypothetical protein
MDAAARPSARRSIGCRSWAWARRVSSAHRRVRGCVAAVTGGTLVESALHSSFAGGIARKEPSPAVVAVVDSTRRDVTRGARGAVPPREGRDGFQARNRRD